jgi:(1->4)-alpha-D-glucan 1-alpha-D-glucosylmutase
MLAEMPELWLRCVSRWQRWNARCKRAINGSPAPDPAEELFIYQTLIGAWPIDGYETGSFQERLQGALLKSLREAKLHTSWSNPNPDYERAVAEFVTTILTPAEGNRFLEDFGKFQRRVAAAGACLSLAQRLLRLASPGVPDIYQGAELWELSLVDPDNRRPVDFEVRRAMLDTLAKRDIGSLMKDWQSGAVKQYVIQRTLHFRRDHPEVFRRGEYIPLEIVGPDTARIIAFARHAGMEWVIAAAPRFPAKLSRPGGSIGKLSLTGIELAFPSIAPRRWSNIFTGETIEVSAAGRVPMSGILGRFPVALLTSLPD